MITSLTLKSGETGVNCNDEGFALQVSLSEYIDNFPSQELESTVIDFIDIEEDTDVINMEAEESIQQLEKKNPEVTEDNVDEDPMNHDGDNYEPITFFKFRGRIVECQKFCCKCRAHTTRVELSLQISSIFVQQAHTKSKNTSQNHEVLQKILDIS